MLNISKHRRNIIYSQYPSNLDYFINLIPDCYVLSGEISAKDRKIVLDEINTKKDQPLTVVLSSVCAEGISFREMDAVHVVEPYWDMSRVQQAVHRAVRTGSHADCSTKVYAYLYIVDDTVDEIMYNQAAEILNNLLPYIDLLKS